MAKYLIEQSDQLDNQAEGSADANEQRDPVNPLKTSTMRVINALHTSDRPTSETGLNHIIQTSIEGDDSAEEQDAALTQDERTPEPELSNPIDIKAPVLIVEDTVELAEVIQATLESIGLKVVYETHGKTGLARLKEINPGLLIMDIGLPDITGWKMLEQIKAHYTSINKSMPTVIVITAYGDPANRLIGKLQNIHSYLIKPFTPDEVERLVKYAIRGENAPSDSVDGEAESSPS